MRRTVTVLGIDPGLANLGYGVIRSDGIDSEAVEYGTVKTKPSEPEPARLLTIYNEVRALAERVEADLAAMETLYFAKNTKTAMAVAQARGVALAAVGSTGVEIRDVTPLQIKKALVGYGRAEKGQIQLMAQRILGLDKIPRPDHAADALAVALTCAHMMGRRVPIIE